MSKPSEDPEQASELEPSDMRSLGMWLRGESIASQRSAELASHRGDDRGEEWNSGRASAFASSLVKVLTIVRAESPIVEVSPREESSPLQAKGDIRKLRQRLMCAEDEHLSPLAKSDLVSALAHLELAAQALERCELHQTRAIGESGMGGLFLGR